MKNAFFILSILFVMGFTSLAYAEKPNSNLKPAQNLIENIVEEMSMEEMLEEWEDMMDDDENVGDFNAVTVSDIINALGRIDTDGDGIPDAIDRDDDGDGIADKYKDEELHEFIEDYLDELDDEDFDDLLDELDDMDSEENKVGAFQYNPTIFGGGVDTDGDGIVDAIDCDDDNDTIPDDQDRDDDGDGIPDILEGLIKIIKQGLKRHNM